jgi:hypothetical protein
MFFEKTPQRIRVGGWGGHGLRGLGGSPRRELRGFRRGDWFYIGPGVRSSRADEKSDGEGGGAQGEGKETKEGKEKA